MDWNDINTMSEQLRTDAVCLKVEIDLHIPAFSAVSMVRTTKINKQPCNIALVVASLPHPCHELSV
jgi:hypothetical protein